MTLLKKIYSNDLKKKIELLKNVFTSHCRYFQIYIDLMQKNSPYKFFLTSLGRYSQMYTDLIQKYIDLSKRIPVWVDFLKSTLA